MGGWVGVGGWVWRWWGGGRGRGGNEIELVKKDGGRHHSGGVATSNSSAPSSFGITLKASLSKTIFLNSCLKKRLSHPKLCLVIRLLYCLVRWLGG